MDLFYHLSIKYVFKGFLWIYIVSNAIESPIVLQNSEFSSGGLEKTLKYAILHSYSVAYNEDCVVYWTRKCLSVFLPERHVFLSIILVTP